MSGCGSLPRRKATCMTGGHFCATMGRRPWPSPLIPAGLCPLWAASLLEFFPQGLHSVALPRWPYLLCFGHTLASTISGLNTQSSGRSGLPPEGFAKQEARPLSRTITSPSPSPGGILGNNNSVTLDYYYYVRVCTVIIKSLNT